MSKRIYLTDSVLDVARQRLRFVFSEFENVNVNFSGGKDSTVTLALALDVAEEMGRLPLRVTFIDQEAEWQATVDYVRAVMDDPRIDGRWLQVPMRMFNATSEGEGKEWLRTWDPDAEDRWIHPRQPDAVTENVYGTDRFMEMFAAVQRHDFPDAPAVNLAGVRAEESPARALGLTTYVTYKGETWGSTDDKRRRHVTLYPIYDWSYSDVWKLILERGLPYNRLYDWMYQHGTPVREMRVSNVIHETGTRSLTFLQEFESATWNRVAARLSGINTVKHLGSKQAPKELPWMFDSWEEYRDHLLANLITNEGHRDWYRRRFASTSDLYRHHEKAYAALLQTHVAMLLVNDHHGTKLSTFQATWMNASKNRGARSGRVN